MWQFVRDFFNLFFILTLLYIAFTTIFQVSKDYKKALLNLVIMALLVNFSFPISRFLIDAGNVPMYYFANQIVTIGGGSVEGGLGVLLSVSELEKILIGGDANSESFNMGSVDFSRLIVSCVFMFMFAITLLTFSVTFIIRLVALLILVIFSSVGFAGTVIPGMNKFASQWWESFTQYVLYGPAAMLMLLMAVRFFSEIGTSRQEALQAMRDASTNVSASGMSDFFASMAMFSIPIIMLWMAIGLANKMSIAGSAAVTGAGFTAIAWARKKTVGGVTGVAKWGAYRNPIARGVGQGMKERLNEGKLFGVNYGKNPVGKLLTGNFWKSPSATEAVTRGLVGTSTVEKEMAGRHRKMVNDRIAEDKKNNVDSNAHIKNLSSDDAVEREAAALALANDKELRTTEQLKKAIQVLAASNNQAGIAKALDNAKDGAVAGLDADAYKQIVGFAGSNENTLDSLNSRVKKVGNVQVKVAYDVSQHMKGGMGEGEAYKKAFTDNKVVNMQAADLAKQQGLVENDHFKAFAKEKMSTDQLKKVMEKATETGDNAVRAWGKIVVDKESSGSGSLKPEDFIA